MRLNDWQRELEAYLLGEPPPSCWAACPALSAEEGLAIYHNAYRARLLDTLRDDYPALHQWLGDDEFERLAQAYLRAHPSQHYSLRWLGTRLPTFLDGAAQSEPLAELARLEWAFTLAFDAADGAPLTLEAMASLSPAEWPGLQVRLLPSSAMAGVPLQQPGAVARGQGRSRGRGVSGQPAAGAGGGLPGLAPGPGQPLPQPGRGGGRRTARHEPARLELRRAVQRTGRPW